MFDLHSLHLSQCLTGITGLICLESDNESEGNAHEGSSKSLRTMTAACEVAEHSEINSNFPVVESPVGTGSEKDHSRLCLTINEPASGRNDTNDEIITGSTNRRSFDGSRGM